MTVANTGAGAYRHDPGVITCRGCGGRAPRGAGSRSPAGWYGLSVSLPETMTSSRDRGYVWVGQFCSIACLDAAVPELEQAEQLAQQAYEPVRPAAS
jgi:hypothetical protein